MRQVERSAIPSHAPPSLAPMPRRRSFVASLAGTAVGTPAFRHDVTGALLRAEPVAVGRPATAVADDDVYCTTSRV
jgi:hypothetical protein